MPAKYGLNNVVFPLIRAGHFALISPKSSTDRVVAVFQHMNLSEASDFIISEILKLNGTDFSTQQYATGWNLVWDIYGKQISGINWFIKFFVEPDQTTGLDYLAEVSFHPLERDLKLESGVVLERNWP